MNDFSNTKFLYSAIDKKIKHNIFQIALMGRSNVGKSSLINHLCQNRLLARTSAKPGKTQLINFFEISSKAYLVDLPGYGYANIPKSVKKTFSSMIENYLIENIKKLFVLVLLDIRHLPSQEDIKLIEWLEFYKISYHITFTKCDKIPEKNLQSFAEKNLASFPVIRNSFYFLYSTKDKLKRKILINILNEKILDGSN
jgi:GTP-binding protein